MGLYFDNSSPDRAKRARRAGYNPVLLPADIPPAEPYELFTLKELIEPVTRRFVFDVECYPNYFLVGFKDIDTNKVIYFEQSPSVKLDVPTLTYLLHRHLMVGFNSKVYDLPLIGYAIEGHTTREIKNYSNQLIQDDKPEFNINLIRVNHIDLIEVAPLTGSLKMYAARLHAPRLQELPFQHEKELTYQEAMIVKDYNINDLLDTQLLYNELKPFIELREVLGGEYNQDWRSKSDAQVAEALMLSELRKMGVKISKSPWKAGDTFKYTKPDFIKFNTPQLQHVLEVIENVTFKIADNNYADTPKEITELEIHFGNLTCQMGNGGLHSKEKSLTIYSTDEVDLIDEDVASYYPRILIVCKCYPKHLGENFIKIYEEKIVIRRLQAKLVAAMKKIADALKIAANGIFGKEGDPYSPIYAPDALLNITIGGQLSLLMFIEMLTQAGFEVVSANTDGVVTNVPKKRYDDFNAIKTMWENISGFSLEEAKYKSLHARDINNYIAIKEDGGTKVKGIYAEVGSALNSVLSKNPECLVINDAIKEFLSRGTPIKETIRNCTDVRRYVSVRNVKGGAEKDGKYLGRVVRWYYSNSCKGVINYCKTGNAVPKTENARPLMILPKDFSLPEDLDIDYYINEATDALYDLGVLKQPTTGRLL